MGKHPKKLHDDIAGEPYKGPDPIAAAAGEGFIAHFQWAILGLLGGGLATWAFHKPIIEQVGKWRQSAIKLQEEGSTIQRGFGKLINGVFGYGKDHPVPQEYLTHVAEQHQHGFGLWLINHTIGVFPGGKQFIQRHMSERLSIAVTGGGLFAFFGYVVLPWFLLFQGAKKGIEGKRQFETAKDEIITLRAENEQLRDAHGKVRTIETEGEPHENKQQRQRNTDEGVNLESPGSITEPKIEPPTPAAPPVEKPHTAKIERPKADLDWAEHTRAKQEAAAKDPALA